MKISISNNINIDLFCENPLQILESSNDGAVEILKDNIPVFYAVTPAFLKKIFDIEYNSIYENANIPNINKKFPMNSKWTPDKDFIFKAHLWGISLNETVSKTELRSFISYWEAEGCFFHHIQWQQKLARSLQKSRSFNNFSKKRDITYIPKPDKTVPDGFRGK